MTSLENFKLLGTKVEVSTYKGRKALRVTEDPNSPDGVGLALITTSNFSNGILEVDVVGMPAPGAGTDARGFVGVAFRSVPDGTKFEYFYIRPTNGRADDQLRRNHSAQYASEPDYPWQRLRQENPGVYESYADIEPGAWTKLRIVVEGLRAELYVNGAPQPALLVKDLKLGATHGEIGLWIGSGTEAYFADLSVTPTGPSAKQQGRPSIAQPSGAQKRQSEEAPGDALLTDADEVRLGADMAAQFDQRRGIGPTVETTQIQSYLQNVADRISPLASRKLTYRIHYDPHPGFRSAFALPGGHIIVGGGVLSLMRTEDELAGVLAHEIIHIDAGQVTQRVLRLAKEQHLSVRDNRGWDVGDFGATYAKEQELACDRDGVKLVVRAGYSPRGMLRLLEVFRARAAEASADAPPTRSILDDRIEQLQNEIRRENWDTLMSQRPLVLPQ